MFQKIINSYKEKKESMDWKEAMLSRQSLKKDSQSNETGLVVVEQNEIKPAFSFAI